MTDLEIIAPDEADQIDHIVDLTLKQLRNRYEGSERSLRGVHPKDHGCVAAKFRISDDLTPELQVGLFRQPGQEFDAWVRFSNAATLVAPDSEHKDGVTAHGSRGMAVKVMAVSGVPLVTTNLMTTRGPLHQDLLMVNHPVFAFANIVDYEALSRIILEDNEKADRFFKERIRLTDSGTPDLADPATRRALVTARIIERIRSAACPPAFQPPPLSPLDNRYFSAAPFLFGDGRIMKFGAKPVAPMSGALTDVTTDANYLRTALQERLSHNDHDDVVFEFQVQIREASELKDSIDTEIEDVCVEWDEVEHPFETVATIAIPPQDCSSAERVEFCESLIFSPWNGLAEHRPLGGINRLRKAVYEASSNARKAIASTACPYSRSGSEDLHSDGP